MLWCVWVLLTSTTNDNGVQDNCCIKKAIYIKTESLKYLKKRQQSMKSDVFLTKELLDYCHQAVTVIRFCQKVLNSKMPQASSYDSLSKKLIRKKMQHGHSKIVCDIASML